ncbi:hypothetical protein DL1_11880 [Thioclava dalianensis]|uniref:Uncharacterized protein n=1 Tax=Thioclava dalianensis TaxID=1185766 RepID=A0A074U166_9RHOB|nr:hypothetical protein [Thioclava dalianensis]KEP68407.1 hypothetical protein DL1_11880 [Thioclava dalianensis]SFN62342.1 hypothetical protein SAMN05216224_10840 [Thioclava dalianensis]
MTKVFDHFAGQADLLDRRPDGFDLAFGSFAEARRAWQNLSQRERLSIRSASFDEGGRRWLRKIRDLCPSKVGCDDWVAMTDSERLAAMRGAATPPESCGPMIGAAPARGAFEVFHPVEMIPDAKSEAGFRAEEMGYRGRSALRAVDVFDRMIVSARKARKPAPLTPAQISIGRHYRDLCERHDAGGMKLASLEGRQGSGGRGGDFMDAYLSEGRELDALRRKIGGGVAMQVRRVRPSARGAGARTISDGVLVDAVCLEDQTLSEVLCRFGWSAKTASNRAAVCGALCAALDRMIGYREKGD